MERIEEGEEQGLGRGPMELGSKLGAAAVPSPPTFLPIKYTEYTLQPFSTPEEIDQLRYRRNLALAPTPGIWSPPGDRRGNAGQAWMDLRSLLPCCLQSQHLSFSSCLFPLEHTETLPSDSEIAPFLQTHSSLPRCTTSGDITCLSPAPSQSLYPLLHLH